MEKEKKEKEEAEKRRQKLVGNDRFDVTIKEDGTRVFTPKTNK